MIEIKNVSMNYGSTVALDRVSFSVGEEGILGLLGPNGAGKSTLMKILTTFICPSQGTAKIGGFDILENPLQVREMVGYLPESVPLYMDMRVDEYFEFVGHARGIQGAALDKRFKWLREACGIASVWKHGMHELSKGYRQRVGLAQALIHDPKVLILDEPTSGLDPLQIIGIRRLVKELSKEKIIIFSTHVLKEAEVLADRIVIINEGKIVSQGTREELAEAAMKYRCHVLTVKEDKASVERALSGLRTAKDITFVEQNAQGFVTFEVKSSFQSDETWREIDALNKEKGWPVKTFSERTFNLEDMFIALLSKNKKEKMLV
ncbi:MAG TPA: ATP-binding cassette domain-containing protein, partial [Candidatus Omnitrophota bacterium]|nr:ATP-binding cassette domain-containing protein [Candidatus Omnitrophota bacterium]